MKIVAIIPSRYESSRFQGKPLALIAGKPMVEHVYTRACQAKLIEDVMVATDDKRIFNAVAQFGGKAIITSAANRSGTDRLAEAAEKMNLAADDLIVNIQGDQPLLNPRSIDEMVQPHLYPLEKQTLQDSPPAVQMSTLAFKIVNKQEITNPKDVKVVFDSRGFALYFSRSPVPCARDASEHFATYKHLGFYAYKRSFLDTFRQLPTGHLENIEKLEQLRALEYGHSIQVIITPHDSPEVDLPEDIARIEKLLVDSEFGTRNSEC
ncbi:3-deoxy-manno-octulosonate cytidylyltransferase [Desulfococcaceae bacterium HSG9]|nr:3-deoxy-manno-octulosonate cytidylyltransferase [Desulfococcaceae bacterium HSG9]